MDPESAVADLLVRAATVHFEDVPPTAAVARAAVGAYFAELDERFPGGFDPGPGADAGLLAMTRPDGCFVVATEAAQGVACGGVQRLDTDTVEVKRMWVSTGWRGVGLGARLLAHLEREAVLLGCRRIVLDTNGTLSEAIAMYERAGYRSIDRYNDNPYAQAWFEKPVDTR